MWQDFQCNVTKACFDFLTTDTENQPSKCAREKRWGVRQRVELFSGEQFNSFHSVFIIFLSPRCTVTRGKGTVKESKFELHVVKTNQGHLSQRHQAQKQNVIDKISTILGWTQSKYHTSYLTLFCLVFPHVHLYLPLSVTLSCLLLLCLSALFYSRHATSIRDRPWPHFLCGCSLLSSCQGATSATDDWQRGSSVNESYCVRNDKCQDTKTYIFF